MKYQVIYADPPWKYKATNPPCKIEKQPETCSADYYYETMSLSELKELDIKNITDKDCVLFLWATTPAIEDGFELLKSWGFKYKTMITWEKTNKDCMGYWFRVCTEHLLVGVKGNIKAFRSMNRTLYASKRERHSKKPDYFYDLIEEVCQGSKIELFARKKREGWDSMGLEINGEKIKL